MLAANAAKPIESPVQPNAEATEQTDRSNPRAWLAWAAAKAGDILSINCDTEADLSGRCRWPKRQ